MNGKENRANDYCVEQEPDAFIDWLYVKKAELIDSLEREYCHGDGAKGYAEWLQEGYDRLIGDDGSC